MDVKGKFYLDEDNVRSQLNKTFEEMETFYNNKLKTKDFILIALLTAVSRARNHPRLEH